LDLRIEPRRINPGESALLTWQTQNASEVRIAPNIGSVDLSGKIKFFPDETSTYSVTAKGPGGSTTRSVTVEVALGISSDISVENVNGLTVQEQFAEFVKPVFFAFDSAQLSQEAKLVLDSNIQWLSRPENNRLRFVLEGHADERGSEEYNLALGDMRAQVVRDYLIASGIDLSRIQTVSLGEERPFDRGTTEEAYARNRRTQFLLSEE
jgi:peptidoglycan-associated lipoprotein